MCLCFCFADVTRNIDMRTMQFLKFEPSANYRSCCLWSHSRSPRVTARMWGWL